MCCKSYNNFQLIRSIPESVIKAAGILSYKANNDIKCSPLVKSLVDKMEVHGFSSGDGYATIFRELVGGLEIASNDPMISAILQNALDKKVVIKLYYGESSNHGSYGLGVIHVNNVQELLSSKLQSTLHQQKALINVVSTLIHELTHFVLDTIYANNCNPFLQNDKISEDMLDKIKDAIIAVYKENYAAEGENYSNILHQNNELTRHLVNSELVNEVLGYVDIDSKLINLSNIDCGLYRYTPEKYNLEIPAWYMQARTYNQFQNGALLFKKIMFVNNPDLQCYMQKVVDVIKMDTGVRAEINEYFSGNPLVIPTIMDYVHHNLEHEEAKVVEVMGDV